MIVYLLLNEIEERSYVGQTTNTLNHRVSEHWDASRSGGSSVLHEAMRTWNVPELWTAVVLQNCYTQEELDLWESWWIEELSTRMPGVGYNVRSETGLKPRSRGGSALTADVKPNSPLSGLTLEQRREYFRAAGKRGAARSKTRLSR